jgi:hypothetical protein
MPTKFGSNRSSVFRKEDLWTTTDDDGGAFIFQPIFLSVPYEIIFI